MAIDCIDISAWQGKVGKTVWRGNKEDIPMAILRCSYTERGRFVLHEDKCYEANFVAAYREGIRIGAYHYSQATSESEAKKEAQFALKIIKYYEKKYNAKVTVFVAFDWEFGQRLSAYIAKQRGKQGCKQICDAFCRVVRAENYTPAVYANLSTLCTYIASDIWKYWNIWVAQYKSRCDYKHPHLMWQYTSSGHVSGISGRIDMNYYYAGALESATEEKPKKKYPYELPKLPARGWFSSGDKGEEVRKLQRFLNWYGDYGLDLDGEVGRKTIDAVRQYEGREKLAIDGNFGKQCLDRAKTVKR